jgi:hypothetical protein
MWDDSGFVPHKLSWNSEIERNDKIYINVAYEEFCKNNI